MTKESYMKFEVPQELAKKTLEEVVNLLQGSPAGIPGGEIIIWGDSEEESPQGWSLLLHPTREPVREGGYAPLLRLSLEEATRLASTARRDLLELLQKLPYWPLERLEEAGLLEPDEEEARRLAGLLKRGLFGW